MIVNIIINDLEKVPFSEWTISNKILTGKSNLFDECSILNRGTFFNITEY